jgi:hypothetical protein
MKKYNELENDIKEAEKSQQYQPRMKISGSKTVVVRIDFPQKSYTQTFIKSCEISYQKVSGKSVKM